MLGYWRKKYLMWLIWFLKLDIKQLKISLEKLKADTKPRWGRMNSSQMLKHCNRQAKLYCNEYNSNFFVLILAHTIGKLHLLYVKYYINYDINKYKKNSKDAIDQNVFGAPSYVFENEIFWGQDRLEYLEDAIKKTTN